MVMSERVLLTVLVLVVAVGVLALMRWGWLRRAARQSDIAPPTAVPPLPPAGEAPDVSDVRARYLGANRSGDWLDRVVVHGLGTPSEAAVSVRTHGTTAGVWIARTGATDVFLPAGEVVGARHDRAAAGRAGEKAALVVIEWARPSQAIDLGLRVRDVDDAEQLRSAIAALAAPAAAGGQR